MGRPINKRFFANLSVPPIGGEGVASIAVGGTNTGKTAVPAIVIAAPQLPGGTQAVARAHMELHSIVNFLAGDGYAVGDVLTLTEPSDAATVRATLTVTAIDDPDTNGVGPISTVSITTRGDYTALPTGTHPAGDITRYSVTGGTGTGADFNTTWRVKNVEVITAGSGYASAPAITTQGGTTFTATLTTGTGGNALAVTARIAGGTARAADIIKQEASRRYLIENADGQGQCILAAKNNGDLAVGEMNIIATDANGSTYYVTKLTNRRATLTRRSMVGSYLFVSGDAPGWTLGSATGLVVSIANS